MVGIWFVSHRDVMIVSGFCIIKILLFLNKEKG